MVLAPVLFIFFKKKFELWINSVVAKIIKDTKLFRMMKTKADFEKLQEDLSNWQERGI